MKVLFDLTHPAHVHLFKNTIWQFETEDVETRVMSREKDLTTDLLDLYDIDHTIISSKGDRAHALASEWLVRALRLSLIALSFDPDVIVSRFNPAAAHAGKISGTPSIQFDDTEQKPWIVRKLTYPFADCICTPDCFGKDLGTNHRRYPGYHELAYLHPKRFDPDPSVLEDVELTPDDQFVILRLVGWNAVHDMNEGGMENISNVVEALEKSGVQVFVTSEGPIPDDIEHCQISVKPNRIHHLMYYADLYLGESVTMATESAVLGTPVVLVSSIRTGYTYELEDEYQLLFGYGGEDRQYKGIQKAIEILEDYEPSLWTDRRETLLSEKVDTTEYIVDTIREFGT